MEVLSMGKSRRKKTHEEFVNEVYELVGNEYEVKSEYIGALKKITMFHAVCGRTYDVLPGNFSFGQRCGKCQGLQKTHEDFIREVETKFGNEYTIFGEYVNTLSKVLVKHNKCDYEWEVYPLNLLKGKSKCPLCSNKAPFRTESFKQVINEITNGEYIVTGNYVNNKTKIAIKHLNCNYEWEVTPNAFKDGGKRCPKCSVMSKGEHKIYDYLIDNNIKFSNEYTFHNCKNINSLPFDFAIFNKEGDVFALIEFDGVQHYEPIEWFGGENVLKYTQFNDTIKNNFCHDNNIPLLRIPHWEIDNIEIILDSYLIKLDRYV
jgi:hypothetical protein